MNTISMGRFALENFKGITKLSISFRHQDAQIMGQNGTGKTTLYDAYLWLLLGKDSKGRADFQVKPVDADGNEVHNCVTAVEAEFTDGDGRTFTLRKEREEIWKKKRGQVEQEFSGHTITPMINGVAKTAKEYASFIEAHFTDLEKVFILSCAAAFNEMPWQDRRGYLVSMADEGEADKSLFSSPEFSGMQSLLEGYGTPAEAKKALAAQKKKANDELTVLPARIDEVRHGMPTVTEGDHTAAERMIQKMDEEMTSLENGERSTRTAMEAVMKVIRGKTVELEQVRSEMRSRQRLLQDESGADRQNALRALESMQKHQSDAESRIGRLVADIVDCDEAIARRETETQALREKHTALHTEKSNHLPKPESSDEMTCPTCGQTLPQEEIEAAKHRAEESWQQAESKRIADIEREQAAVKEKGIANNGKIEQDKARRADLTEKLDTERAMLATILEKIEDQKLTLDSLPESTLDIDADPEYTQLKKREEAMMGELESMHQPASHDERYTVRKREVQQIIDDSKAIIAKRSQAEAAEARIAELSERQRELGQTVATLEGQIAMVEQFVAARCKLLEDSINRLFPTVRWKLFDVQINSGIADVCTCLVNGVPYPDANNAARINAGLEIISVLSGEWGVSLPVFVDNAESINDIRPVQGQMITLVVTSDKQLQIDTAALTA